MFRSLKLLFSAGTEWEKMSLNPPHPLVVFFISILPLLAAMLAVEGWGLMRFGEIFGDIGRVRVPEERIVKYLVFYGVASIIVILVGAILLQNVGASFNLRNSFGDFFTLIAYGYSPVFFCRVLDALPQVNTWVCWALAAMLSIRILYHGVAHWLKPEQTKGLGVFLVTLIFTVVASGFVHFASVQVLKGRFLKEIFPAPESPASSASTNR